ncbi:MAG: hypothetical protein RBU28_05660 [Bacteroidales bacterium]|jgi:hypothetical protein|nr:hypothetical protein [Bacteroidales bacterium]
MNKIILFLFFVVFAVSCSDPDDGQTAYYLRGEGAFIINEGNFRWGNGSLSFYSYDSSRIYNAVFESVNGRPLGDVPFSMTQSEKSLFIVVNNSGKIEIANTGTLRTSATIDSLVSPRFICLINGSKAYVTSLYSDSLVIFNPSTARVTGFINLECTSESIIKTGDKVYVANWSGGNELIVLDPLNDRISSRIEVGAEPESMVIDRDNGLWVLCSGGWSGDSMAELVRIDTETDQVATRLVFPDRTHYPSSLNINKTGDTLYFIDNGVRRMSINDPGLPSVPFIEGDNHYFYRLAINNANGEIFVTDAVDFSSRGYVIRYDRRGELIEELEADIIPGAVNFKYAN